MALNTKQPADLPTTNALDALPDDLLDVPPAYYKFGTSPAAMENPIAYGETEVLMVRVACTGLHGPLARKDGEQRYERSLTIQACWRPGEKPPPDDADQPALIGTDGEITSEASEEDDEDDNVSRPDFSDKGK